MNRTWRPEGESNTARCRRLNVMFRAGRFEELIEELREDICSALQRVRGITSEQRDDLAQDTVVYLLTEWRRGRTYGGASLIAVARRRARWIALDFFDAQGEAKARGFKIVPLDYAFPTHDEAGLNNANVVEAPDPGPRPDELAFEKDFVGTVLGKLPAREREVFRLRCFEGLGSHEVAERLHCEANAVDQAYHRAKRRLRDEGLDL
jgi:RNA polymerase sigma factor (sigma-70 family)